MAELDELSRVIGNIEGRLEGIEDKLDYLCKITQNHLWRTRGQAGGISLFVSAIVNAVIAYFRA